MFVNDVFFINETEHGRRIVDQMFNPWTREQWLELRTAVDAYFATNPDEQIAEECQAIYDRYFSPNRPRVQSKPKPRKPKPGYLYLLHGEGTAWYKIGISKQPDYRVKTIGAKAPFPVTTLAIIETPDMLAAEQEWHDLFDAARVNGEWFELQPADVDLFLDKYGVTRS